MSRKVIGFVGSVAVALLIAAAGIKFDAATLTYGGIIIGALVIVAWLWFWAHPPADPAQSAIEAERREQRRQILKEGRWLAQDYTMQARVKRFRDYLEWRPEYPAVRAHLSAEYLKKLNAPRTAYVSDGAGKYESLVQWFLDDLDRLEREWGLI